MNACILCVFVTLSTLTLTSTLSAKRQIIQRSTLSDFSLNSNPRVEIEYCTGCRWLLRSAWLAQELLTTFEKEIGEVALIPSRGISGTFVIRIEGSEVWNRKESGFPDVKEIKQIVRDKISPDMSLGHSDKKTIEASFSPENKF